MFFTIHYWRRSGTLNGASVRFQSISHRLRPPHEKPSGLTTDHLPSQKKAEQAWLYSQKNLIKSSPFCRSTPFFPPTRTSAYCDCCSFNQHPEAIHQTNYTDFLCPSIDSDAGLRRIVDSFALPVMIYENSSRYFTLHISPLCTHKHGQISSKDDFSKRFVTIKADFWTRSSTKMALWYSNLQIRAPKGAHTRSPTKRQFPPWGEYFPPVRTGVW